MLPYMETNTNASPKAYLSTKPNRASTHEKAYARAIRYGWVIYRGHAVAGELGKGWVVTVDGDTVFEGRTAGECFRAIDEVVDEI